MLKENLLKIKEDLKNFPHIKILAVSKGQNIDSIKEAYDLGLREFGESYAQELLEKVKQTKVLGLKDIIWHFIGKIQSNKIKIISLCDVIQSISSFEKALKINNIAKKKIDIYLQVNLSLEDDRQGFNEFELYQHIPMIKKLKNLNIKGIMTILPLKPEKPAKDWFRKMKEIKENILEKKLLKKIELSMGMSNDFLDAAEFGASMVRLGEKLFGKRHE